MLATLCVANVSHADGARLTLRMARDAGHRAAVVVSVALSPDAGLVAAAGDDHRVRLWRASDGEPVRALVGHDDWVRGVRFAPDGPRVATVADDQTLRLWNLGAEQRALSRRLIPAAGPLRGVAFHPNGTSLAAIGYGAGMTVYNAATGQAVSTHECPCEDMLAVAYSPDGRWIAAGGRDGDIRVWDMRREGVAIDLRGDGRRVRAVAFSPDSGALAAAGEGPAIRVWEIEPVDSAISPSLPAIGVDAPMHEILTRPGKNYSLAFVTDRLLAAGGTGDTIRLYDVNTASPLDELRGHTGTVASIAASADGRTLVSGSFDATVRVWRIDEAMLSGERIARRPEQDYEDRK